MIRLKIKNYVTEESLWHDLNDYFYASSLIEELAINAGHDDLFSEEQDELRENFTDFEIVEFDCFLSEADDASFMTLEKWFELEEFLQKDENMVLAIYEAYCLYELLEYGIDNYTLISHVKTYEQLGRYLLEDRDVPEFLECYIDYEKYGEDCEDGQLTEYGYLITY